MYLVATGAHMSPIHGETYQVIESDGFLIDKKINMDLCEDGPLEILKSMGRELSFMGETFKELAPDLILILGDRYEIFVAATAAMMMKIPIAHIHGGEKTVGAIDDAMRHAITKMSHLHFTSTEIYRQRVIQLGEIPAHVFNFGAIGIDNIKKIKRMTKSEVEQRLGRAFKQKNLLITYHPATLENSSVEDAIKEIFSALDDLEDTLLIFTNSNADHQGQLVNKLISDYVKQNPDRSMVMGNMGQELYLSVHPFVDAVVGNSSSGIMETPSFKIGTINIGTRQQGRVMAGSVINCSENKNSLLNALNILYSEEFQKKLRTVENPHGEGGLAEKIHSVLQTHQLEGILKKDFYDLSLELK